MSLSILAQQLLAAQTTPRPEEPKREKPVKYGFCVRHQGEGKLRFNRWGAKGEAIFNNYCEECHRAYMAAYREKHFVGRTRISRPGGKHAD